MVALPGMTTFQDLMLADFEMSACQGRIGRA